MYCRTNVLDSCTVISIITTVYSYRCCFTIIILKLFAAIRYFVLLSMTSYLFQYMVMSYNRREHVRRSSMNAIRDQSMCIFSYHST